MKQGRPPKEGFSEEECIALGERFIAWMKKCDEEGKITKEYPVHLSEFYGELEDIDPDYWHDCLSKRDCFSGYYKKGANWMAKNIMRNKDLATAYGSRYLGMYDKAVRKHERSISQEKAEDEAKAKAALEAAKNVPPNDATIQTLLDTIAELKSQLNESKSKAD